MSFGPSSAFGSFPSATRPISSRRVPSSGSVKEDMKHASSGPTPNDSTSTPTLGSWESVDRERDSSNSILGGVGGLTNGHSRLNSISTSSDHQRSFSSILSPSLPVAANSPVQDPLKPFVYSREFLLSLYDEGKASRRPIELARHEIATRDTGGKPWALSDWRDGEKELFSTSIHPPTARNTTSRNTRSDNTSNTLDLSTLGTLPRERDRAQSQEPELSRGSLTAGIGNSSNGEERKRGTLGTMGAIGSGSGGLSGGVLGGMMGSRAPIGTSGTRRDAPGTIAGGKEVWQGGRWRRGGTAEPEEEKRPSAFGARRFATPEVQDTAPIVDQDLSIDDQVPTSWDADELEPSISSPSPITETVLLPVAPTVADSYLSEPDLAHHAVNVLGSLSLDSDPTDDPLLRPSPPGLPPPAPVEVDWQYRDPSGQVQGPFSSTMMHDWYRQNFFSGDLAVKRVTESAYETLEMLVRRSPDAEKPFLSAPLQPVIAIQPLPSTASWGNPISSPNGLPAGGQRNFSGSFYEQFSGQNYQQNQPQQQQQSQQSSAFGYSQHQQSQQQAPASSGLDPWGAPLPSTDQMRGYAPTPAWQDSNNNNNNNSNVGGMYDGRFGGFQQTQQQQPQYQNQQQQIPQQQQQQQQNQFRQQSLQPDPLANDVFGRQPTLPTSPFFDPSQLTATATPDWSRLNNLPAPIQATSPQLQQQLPSLAQTNWTTGLLTTPSLDTLPAATSVIAPATSLYEAVAEPAPIVSPWGAIQAVEPVVATLSPAFTPLPLPTPITKTPITKVLEQVVEVETPAIVATPVKPVTISPWTKDDGDSAPSTPSGPSLRQIQEAEARASELRKTADRQVAARTQALAAVQAAQRAAAAEAESLPSSSTWASSSAASSPATKVAVLAPWSKPQPKAGGKTMKEIQEEEEKRKKLAAVAASSAGPASVGGVRGYAGSIGQLAPAKPGAPWTTVGIKPPTSVVVPAIRPIIPGGSVVTPRSVSVPSSLPAKPVAATPIRVVQSPPARPVSRSNGPALYDADSPPPPSSEFLKWTREALKGLTVPMDEFIQMLLSFPLEASADVLEIISDSVYANSSTLDGRRFANDYASRRKLDVAARYPSIVLSKTSKVPGRPTSMAEALKSQPIVKAPEWSVKVQKKKGGK